VNASKDVTSVAVSVSTDLGAHYTLLDTDNTPLDGFSVQWNSLVQVPEHTVHSVRIQAVCSGTLEIAGWGPDWGPRLPPFDGMSSPEDLPNLTEELCRRGFSEAELQKIYHDNYFRVFQQVLGNE